MSRFTTLVCLLVTLFAFAKPTLAAEHVSLVLSNPTDPALVNKGYVVVTLTNDGTTDVTVHKYQTPNWENGRIAKGIFQVSGSAREFAYTGVIEHPGVETPSIFYTLRPGDRRSTTVNLRDYYADLLPSAAPYTVSLSVVLGDHPSWNYPADPSTSPKDDPRRPHVVESNVLHFSVRSSTSPTPPASE